MHIYLYDKTAIYMYGDLSICEKVRCCLDSTNIPETFIKRQVVLG